MVDRAWRGDILNHRDLSCSATMLCVEFFVVESGKIKGFEAVRERIHVLV